jgi:PhnB protein
MKLVPYLYFEGNAEEALNFYTEALGGEIVSMQRYGDAPMPSGEDQKQKVMHATFSFDGNLVMASDVFEKQPLTIGQNVQLSLDVDSTEKLESVFNKMAEGGTVTMALQDTFWGARFGMLKDKFGVLWMFNHDIKK